MLTIKGFLKKLLRLYLFDIVMVKHIICHNSLTINQNQYWGATNYPKSYFSFVFN